MCLLLVAWKAHARYPLVVAANRDERYDRPTRPAAFLPEAPEVLAGRDELAGGTWLGVDRGGRFAALTNHRDPSRVLTGAPSRGRLVTDFLTGRASPRAFARAVAADGERYNGFNLLVADAESMWWVSNRAPAPAAVAPGVHGLSNALLDEPWPKVRTGTRAVTRLLAGAELATEPFLAMLADRSVAADAELPSTGVPLEWERALSARFIVGADYGTRSSCVVLVERGGALRFVERTYRPRTLEGTDVEHRFDLDGGEEA